MRTSSAWCDGRHRDQLLLTPQSWKIHPSPNRPYPLFAEVSQIKPYLFQIVNNMPPRVTSTSLPRVPLKRCVYIWFPDTYPTFVTAGQGPGLTSDLRYRAAARYTAVPPCLMCLGCHCIPTLLLCTCLSRRISGPCCGFLSSLLWHGTIVQRCRTGSCKGAVCSGEQGSC